MARAHYEDITGLFDRYAILRIGDNGWRYPDPGYLFHTAVGGRAETAFLMGLAYRDGIDNQHRDAVRRALLEAGYTYVARMHHRIGLAPQFVRVRL